MKYELLYNKNGNNIFIQQATVAARDSSFSFQVKPSPAHLSITQGGDFVKCLLLLVKPCREAIWLPVFISHGLTRPEIGSCLPFQ